MRLIDVREPPNTLETEETFRRMDVGDLGALQSALGGADAVLHLAGNPNTSATWSAVLKDNIEATRSVFEAARRCAVSKVVIASTNHVVGFDNLEERWPIRSDVPLRPDSLYGVSKAFGEALGRYYSDAFDMSIICLRIGWFTPGPPNVPALNPLWISARDLAQIVQQSLRTSRKFGIYNATSNNAQRHWDFSTARDELGFQPEDDVTSVAEDTSSEPYVDPTAGVLRDL